jgi:hypothetical protein
MQATRVILYHNQATSARMRFLRFAYGSVFYSEPLPKLAVLMDDDYSSTVVVHPAAVIKQTEQELGLAQGDLEAEAEYQVNVDVAGGPASILLARFTGIDPPFEKAEAIQASFIDLTQARGLPQVELECLRKAYELVMGG